MHLIGLLASDKDWPGVVERSQERPVRSAYLKLVGEALPRDRDVWELGFSEGVVSKPVRGYTLEVYGHAWSCWGIRKRRYPDRAVG